MTDSTLKDKIPPHNLEAEQAALGAVLLDPACMAEVATKIKPDSFYSFQNQVIYEAMLSLYKQNIPVDILSLINELTKMGKLEQAGGAAVISELTSLVPTSKNVGYYVSIILEKATRRDLIKFSSEVKSLAFDETHKAQELLGIAEQKIFNLAEHRETSSVYAMSDIVSATIDLIDKHYQNSGGLSGIPTGFAKLDTMTNGFQNSELIIIGARPSIGKTAFALSMMEYIAIEKKIPCGFFSLEMAYQAIGQRLLTQVSRIPSNKVRSGWLSLSDFKKLQDSASLCYNSPLYIVDTPNMQLLELRSMARRMKVEYDVKIIFIDYIGLISTENKNAPVYETVSEISKSLKALARELYIPIVALCLVSREA
ncbi:MAG: replicative DNA helicase [Treponema sp.]|nr:replicative DNA helicase [Treponema sp.]